MIMMFEKKNREEMLYVFCLFLTNFKGDCARSPWGHELATSRIWKFAQARFPVSGTASNAVRSPSASILSSLFFRHTSYFPSFFRADGRKHK